MILKIWKRTSSIFYATMLMLFFMALVAAPVLFIRRLDVAIVLTPFWGSLVAACLYELWLWMEKKTK